MVWSPTALRRVSSWSSPASPLSASTTPRTTECKSEGELQTRIRVQDVESRAGILKGSDYWVTGGVGGAVHLGPALDCCSSDMNQSRKKNWCREEKKKEKVTQRFSFWMLSQRQNKWIWSCFQTPPSSCHWNTMCLKYDLNAVHNMDASKVFIYYNKKSVLSTHRSSTFCVKCNELLKSYN